MNPFTPRGRITEPPQFAGRWRELSLIADSVERRRPVLLIGAAGIGKSSLLTHFHQSASAILARPDLRSYFIDLGVLRNEAQFFGLVVHALGGQGDSLAALEVALVERDGPVLLCIDNTAEAIAAQWGDIVLEKLARMVRSTGDPRFAGSNAQLLLVAAAGSSAPLLSEPFVVVSIGAMGPSETRLIAEAYLDDHEITFSPNDLEALNRLSAGHPAYYQRAAFHLYRAYQEQGYDWKAAYLREARTMPIAGAPLPPAVFEGEGLGRTADSAFGELDGAERSAAAGYQIEGSGSIGRLLIPLLAGIAVWGLSGNWLLVGAAVLAGLVLAWRSG